VTTSGRPWWRRAAHAARWGSLGVAALLVVLLAVSRDARFVVRAAVEEAKILWRRQDLATLAASDAIPMEERARFQLVLDVRAYAADSLGLDVGRTFTRFTRLTRDTLVLVLSASPRDRLAAHTWWFPIVGRVPYRGYFDLEAAEAAAARFAAREYDTHLRPAAAFSTLGWFEDPLLSTALRRGPIGLTELVIHEVTHNTVWVAGSAGFNESFASFVGFRGAEAYFRSRGDTASANRAAAAWRDEGRLSALQARLVDDLTALYDAGVGRDSVLVARETVFDMARARYREAPFEVYDGERLAGAPLNNATVVAMGTYRQDLGLFDAMLDRFDGDLRAAVAALQRALADEGDADPSAVIAGLTPS
jgi:predicted aminopeptidase